MLSRGWAVTLGEKQRKLPLMVSSLVRFAYERGYELTFGDAYRDPRVHGEVGQKVGYGHAKSAHKRRLAVDFNLFRNGVYLASSEEHRPLGEFWESLGGTWGGRFADGNHYSMEHEGVM
jgi:hypothetical protein